MSKCIKCDGGEITDEYGYCYKCGSELKANLDAITIRNESQQLINKQLIRKLVIAKSLLEEIRNNRNLWVASRICGQGKYAGLPPMIRKIDNVLNDLEENK
jgi:frataxin-like iron-binding protein CyaY